ncbi:MAG TPA: RNA polymerase sigma factor region1.1 domain-containing protein [Bradyrhizobium sp.]|jgi:hypothetical protein
MKLSEVIRRAIKLGEGNGTLTFDQLNELIPSNLEPEDIEAVLLSLSAKDIQIVES